MTDGNPGVGDALTERASLAGDLTARFKLVFGSILALTLVSLGVYVALALFADASKPRSPVTVGSAVRTVCFVRAMPGT